MFLLISLGQLQAAAHRLAQKENTVSGALEGMEDTEYGYPNTGAPPVQPGIRPLVDPEAQGEVDPSR